MKCPDCDGEGQGQNCNEGYCSRPPECGCEDPCERCCEDPCERCGGRGCIPATAEHMARLSAEERKTNPWGMA